ncbi:hypothetical protein [Paracoccus shanxieyensis]|uniref:Uncharacterized protein n=2 Tax=Paracoccus shanxieyensis TaxID=2675752 RepID=A0A6L6J579_9RHOB|nr:hypothetical protein [Paracoccus shanxieyensis]MTH65864.1 hypothetical protein [Paracoccus shanxieyensis]MTH89227.1 hypothetical protein [Paracoccus shanxieyensis]
MLTSKKVDFGDFVGSMEFFTVDETVKRTALEHVIRRDLYMADDSEPGGMKLVKRGRAFKANLFSVPRCYLPMP